MAEESDRISYNPWLRQRNITGDILSPAAPIFDPTDPDAPPRLHRHMRPKFQDMLLKYVERTGIEIEWNKRVTEYFENPANSKGGVILSDGTAVESDLIIAADGVGTKSYTIVPGAEVPARSSGYAMYRTAYPVELALADPIVAAQFPEEENGHPIVDMWMG